MSSGSLSVSPFPPSSLFAIRDPLEEKREKESDRFRFVTMKEGWTVLLSQRIRLYHALYSSIATNSDQDASVIDFASL
jgi:hypothetical protein